MLRKESSAARRDAQRTTARMFREHGPMCCDWPTPRHYLLGGGAPLRWRVFGRLVAAVALVWAVASR